MRKIVDVSEKIEQNASKKIKVGTEKYLLTCINNLWEEYSELRLLTTWFGRNNAKKTSILATDQSTDTNRTRMEPLLLLTVTIGPKYLAIGSVQLGNKLITEANQELTSIDRRVNSDQ